MPFVFYVLGFGSVALAGLVSYPRFVERVSYTVKVRLEQASLQLSDIYMDLPQRKLLLLSVAAPMASALFVWLLTGQWFFGAIGFGIGLLIPRMAVPFLKRARQNKFQNQLVDGLLLLSSCLKAGLSMIQGFTVITEEMEPPINQEFALMLKETRMGVNFDEALLHLKQRMPSDDATLFVTAVLVARETGGDITSVFTQLVETIRERRKIKEKIKTLTFMARMQGIIMAMLPIVFSYVTYTIDKTYFQFFLHDPTGQLLLALIVFFQLVGGVLFMRFSRSPI